MGADCCATKPQEPGSPLIERDNKRLSQELTLAKQISNKSLLAIDIRAEVQRLAYTESKLARLHSILTEGLSSLQHQR